LSFAGNRFLDYFVSYAEKLASDQYPVVKGEILRYIYDFHKQ